MRSSVRRFLSKSLLGPECRRTCGVKLRDERPSAFTARCISCSCMGKGRCGKSKASLGVARCSSDSSSTTHSRP
eukprot:389754-Pyramimonas_sp.AAC.1